MIVFNRNLLFLLVLVLSGCSTVARETFYTLKTVPAQLNAESRNTLVRYTVAIGPVQIPELVDRPQLVVRKGANQLAVLEQHRWAQSLDAEIAQALAAGLSVHLPHARIVQSRDTAAQNSDCRIAVDVVRFEAMPGEAVVIQANWTILSQSTKALLTGQSAVRETVSGNNYDAIAEAFSRGILRISEEIGSAVWPFQSPNSQAINNYRQCKEV